MKKLKILLILICLSSTSGFAQNSLGGLVLQTGDSSAIPFAHVFLTGEMIGTTTNEAGEFVLNFPADIEDDTLTISSVGYKTLKIRLKDTQGISRFYLPPADYLLDEVKIYAAADSVVQIVKKAFSEIENNYPVKQYYAEAFYRETYYTDDNKYLRLVEAAVEIQDFGVKKSPEKTKIKTIQVRKSDDHTAGKTVYERALAKVFGDVNTVYNFMIDRSYIKLINRGETSLFDKDFFKDYELSLEKKIYNGQDNIYVISFVRRNYNSAEFRKNRGSSYPKSFIYINQNNWAIEKIETHLSVVRGEKQISFDYVRQYQKIGKLYYPYYYESKIFSSFLEGRTPEHTREQVIYNNYFLQRKNYKRIKAREKARKYDGDFYEKEHEYDPKFWESYNGLLLLPIEKQVELDLAAEKALEEQFGENGKKKD